MNKIVKTVSELVFEITLSTLQVHTTRFVIFTIQRPSDPQVLMLTVRTRLIQYWPNANLHVKHLEYLLVSKTRIHDQL